MTESTAALLNRLRHHIKKEAETQFRRLNNQWSRSLQERVAKGWAIEGLRVANIDKDVIQLVCDTNESRFREGDLLVLHRGSPQDPNALHVELVFDQETRLTVNLIRGIDAFLLADPDNWILDQDWFDASIYHLDALNMVADTLRGRSIILPLLQGSLMPHYDYSRYVRGADEMTGMNLNDSQVEAVAQAYAADLLHLIQGPPGTGKTFMLAHLTRLLVNDGKRVMVTALTHRAIHNALNKIKQVDDSLPVCKIGPSRLSGDLDVENFETFQKSKFGDLTGGYVVGATPFTLHTFRMENIEFDVVIFDEASQITLPLAIMGMLAGDKFIFIGDDKQLPPVSPLSTDDIANNSIFAYLSGRGNETMLNITYRLNDVLTQWPSTTFYNNELQSSQEASIRRLSLSSNHTRWDFILNPDIPAVFVDLCQQNTTVRSRREADVVVELILALLERGISVDEIGVVVPYRAQSRLIRSLLLRNLPGEVNGARIVVDTVERMQGQEREVVIISLTTSSAAFATQLVDFLFQPQRLNVAVTRPKTKMILVGSHNLLNIDAGFPEQEEQVNIFKSLINSCVTITLPDGVI